MRAHSFQIRRRARWAAAAVFTGVLTALTALSAHAAAGGGYNCDTGSYKPGFGLLGAFGCTGSGSTNVFVDIDVVTVPGSGDSSGSYFCTDFHPGGAPDHWSGHCR